MVRAVVALQLIVDLEAATVQFLHHKHVVIESEVLEALANAGSAVADRAGIAAEVPGDGYERVRAKNRWRDRIRPPRVVHDHRMGSHRRSQRRGMS